VQKHAMEIMWNISGIKESAKITLSFITLYSTIEVKVVDTNIDGALYMLRTPQYLRANKI